jgi:type IV secretory pathway VirB3-like protein
MLKQSLQAGFDGTATSIVFLVVGCICIAGAIACGYWLTWCMRNKPDPNMAESKDWFTKWLYKNRMLISMMVTVIVAIVAITFMLQAFGIPVYFAPLD